MKQEIWLIKKKNNDVAVCLSDGEIKCIIEEKKVHINPVEFLQTMYGVKDIKIIELQSDSILRELPHPYYGLSYDKNYVYNLVKSLGVYYELHLHNPSNNIFSTPSKFYARVANLIKSGKKVGWFQGRWKVGDDGIDFNRCVLHNRMKDDELDFNVISKIKDNIILNNVVEGVGYFPQITNMNAYNPIEAINKLKDKELDVLVMMNLIVSNKEEDLKV